MLVKDGGEPLLLERGVVPFTAVDSCQVTKKNVVESCGYVSVEGGNYEATKRKDRAFCRDACPFCFCKTARSVSGHHAVAVGRTIDTVGHTAAALQLLFALNCGSVEMWGSSPPDVDEVRFDKVRIVRLRVTGVCVDVGVPCLSPFL